MLSVLAALAAPPGAAGGAIDLQPEVNLSSSAEPSAVSEMTPQGLAVDPEGRVIAVWSEFRDLDTPPELALRVAGPDGRFGRAVPLTPADGKYSGEGALAVTSEGQVALAWNQKNEEFAIWVARLDLAVGSLLQPVAIPGSGSQLVMEPAIAASPRGELAVAWTNMIDMVFEVKLCRLTLGATFGPVESVSTADGLPSEQPSLAYGPDGRLHVVWTDSEQGVRRIFYAVHDGKKLSAPRPVAAGAEWGKQSRPQVAVGPKGEVVVVWMDSRQGGVDQVFVARAEPGKPFGKAFAATRGAGPARSPAVAVGVGGVYLAWEDERVPNLAEPSSVQIYAGGLKSGVGPVAEEQAVTIDRPVSCTHPAMVLDRAGTLHLMWRNSELGQGDVFYRQGIPGS